MLAGQGIQPARYRHGDRNRAAVAYGKSKLIGAQLVCRISGWRRSCRRRACRRNRFRSRARIRTPVPSALPTASLAANRARNIAPGLVLIDSIPVRTR